jgi:putative ABC transport system permease protein
MADPETPHDLTAHLARALGDDYTLIRELPGGGMSAVFLATERAFERQVVVKVLPRELAGAEAIERFRRETSLAAVLQHPQIVPVLAAGEVAGLPYFVMPFVDGESLRRRLARGPLSLRETVSILADVARALAYAHEFGVTHRDIKPDNILLTRGSAVVADFGVAKAVAGGHRRRLPGRATPDAPAITREGTSLGTPAYMAPEQVVGDPDIDFRADLYALGIVGYEMLAGAPPFAGTAPRRILAAQLAEAPAPLSTRRADVPPALEDLIMRCLAKEPAQRPAAAADVVRALQDPDLLVPRRGGSPVLRRDPSRGGSGGGAWSQLREFVRQDLRVAARRLRRAPGLSIAAVVCLALGIGATTAIAGAVYRALVEPLPFRDPTRLVTVYRTTPQFTGGVFSAPNYLDLAAQARQLTGLAALNSGSALIELADGGRQVSRLRATGNLFTLLGIRALRGRLFGTADDAMEAPRVAVVSEELWRRQWAADEGLVGRTIDLDGAPTTIVGILPAGIRIPHGSRMLHADLWVPMRFWPGERRERRSNFLYALGRLARGATPASAQAELVQRFAGLIAIYPELRGESVRVVPLRSDGARSVRTPLLLLFGAVGLVLLIAVTNVASLLLARGIQRRREMAVRTALGASRLAVMRAVLGESALLAVSGAAVGLALAWIGVRTIGTLAATRMPQLQGLTIDWRIAGLALALALLVAVACGLVPAWHSARADPQDALRGGLGSGDAREHRGILRGLVVVEVGLSLVLLIGAGLTLRGFVGLLHSDPGFDPVHVLTLEATVPPGDYAAGDAVPRFLEPTLDAVRRLPGVASVGAINLLPYDNWGWNMNMRYEGQPNVDPTHYPLVETRVATPGFFTVTGQRLLAGRLLAAGDDARPGSPLVVVANQALAKRDFRDRDPVGHRFYQTDSTLITIVGVVSDIRNRGPFEGTEPEIYYTYRQRPWETDYGVVARVRGDPAAAAGAVTAAIRSVDRRVAISDVRSMNQVIATSLGRPRFIVTLLGVFAGIALFLAIAGVYGVMSYTVAQSTRELGIRAALGGTPAAIVRLMARQGTALVIAGAALGLAAGVLATRLLGSVLYGVSRLDGVTWTLATATIVGTGLIATVVPSLRATQIDPVSAIRAE